MLTSDKLFPYQRKAINHQCTHPASMLWLDMGLGKLQPNSEPVLTPTGWVQMGNLTVGDFVVGSDGKPTEILGVFPQGLCEIVEITFTDGSSCRVGWEHLWYVQNPNQKKRDQVGHVMTTRQLVDSGLTRPMGNRDDAYWYIPMVQPVHFSPVDLPLDPYLVGVILGDGTITPGGSVTVCTDLEIIAACGLNFLRHHEGGSYCAYGSVLGITEVMRSLGMNGKRSWEKEIPPAYLLGNPEQRIALLQGLLDTDGSPIDKGGVEFSSTSESLADGVVELTQSLGGVAKKSGPRITQHQCGDGRPSWRVNVKLPGYLTPFRLVRKLEKWVRPTKYQPIRKMVSAKVVGNEQSTCIKVAATDSLYVTKNYIVTHNTTITLSSVTYLIHEAKYLKAVIIVAPIRVCRLVWRQEAVKWQHTSHLTFSMIVGTKDQRCRALMKKADVYLVNYENLQWLAEALDTYYLSKKLPLPFDGIVYDEVTKTKNSTTNRVKALNKVLPHFKWATGLTGTPASNGYKDLHGQYLVVDGGVRLGTSKSAFKTRFYKKAGYKDIAYDGTESTIKNLIGDITMEMSAADYNPLPDMIVNTVEVEMDSATREKYEQLEKEYFTKLDNGTEIEVFNAASLTNKCLQFSNGATYPVPGMPLWEPIHDLKLEALEDIIEEANGQPILCSYAYRSDAERIMHRFREMRPINLTNCHSEKSLNDAMNRWLSGDCLLMIGHAASMGHGVDRLQHAGHTLVWFGLNWSLDLYEQFNARLRRQGQGAPVICHRILCRDTLDQAQALALEGKATTQDSLRKAVKEYRAQKEKLAHGSQTILY